MFDMLTIRRWKQSWNFMDCQVDLHMRCGHDSLLTFDAVIQRFIPIFLFTQAQAQEEAKKEQEKKDAEVAAEQARADQAADKLKKEQEELKAYKEQTETAQARSRMEAERLRREVEDLRRKRATLRSEVQLEGQRVDDVKKQRVEPALSRPSVDEVARTIQSTVATAIEASQQRLQQVASGGLMLPRVIWQCPVPDHGKFSYDAKRPPVDSRCPVEGCGNTLFQVGHDPATVAAAPAPQALQQQPPQAPQRAPSPDRVSDLSDVTSSDEPDYEIGDDDK